MEGVCDFENRDMCNWMSTEDSDVSWKLNSGATFGAGETGPRTDHTLATSEGFYVYMEASDPMAKPGSKARLISEPFHDDTISCLHFWFHMHGKVSSLKRFENKSN